MTQTILSNPKIQDFKRAFKNAEVYIVFKKVSKDGMSRYFEVYYLDNELNVKDIPISLARCLGSKNNFKNQTNANEKGIYIEGCGMDMSYALWEQLACELDLKEVWTNPTNENEVHQRNLQYFSTTKDMYQYVLHYIKNKHIL